MNRYSMRSFLLLLLLLMTIPLSAQKYRVIKVKGSVKICNSERLIKQGDQIEARLALCFSSTKNTPAALAVIDVNNRNRYILKEGNSKEVIRIRYRNGSGSQNPGIPSDTSDTFLDNLKAPISSSPSNTEEELRELSSFFGSGEFLILGGQLQIAINYIPLNSQSYFQASYEYHGERLVKKLRFDGDNLVLNVNEIFSSGGVPLCRDEVSPITLSYIRSNDDTDLEKGTLIYRYYDESGTKNFNNREKEIATFRPYFAPDIDIKKELAFIIELEGENTNWPELESKLAGYLMDVYGNTDEKALFNWLHKHYGRLRY